uniref:DUF1330 domain-containing protein n=1 Tax=Ascaris lumbricoides TaxID=6252 RepID=A0A0M3HMT8_ASCLU
MNADSAKELVANMNKYEALFNDKVRQEPFYSENAAIAMPPEERVFICKYANTAKNIQEDTRALSTFHADSDQIGL